MRIPSVRFALVLGLVVGAGCATAATTPTTTEAQVPQTLTAAQVQELSGQMPPGKVLVQYLGQPDSDPAVCDMRASGPHLARIDEPALTALAGALVDGKVDPKKWQRCASLVLAQAAEPLPARLLSALADALARWLAAAEANRVAGPQIEALRAVLASRAVVDGPPPPVADALGKMDAGLRASMARLPSAARELVAPVAALVEVDLGRLDGAAVTAATLEGITAEATLVRLSTRLPKAALRVDQRCQVELLAHRLASRRIRLISVWWARRESNPQPPA